METSIAARDQDAREGGVVYGQEEGGRRGGVVAADADAGGRCGGVVGGDADLGDFRHAAAAMPAAGGG